MIVLYIIDIFPILSIGIKAHVSTRSNGPGYYLYSEKPPFDLEKGGFLSYSNYLLLFKTRVIF